MINNIENLREALCKFETAAINHGEATEQGILKKQIKTIEKLSKPYRF